MIKFLFDCGNTCIKFALSYDNTNKLEAFDFLDYHELPTYIDALFLQYPSPVEVKIASVTSKDKLNILLKALEKHAVSSIVFASSQKEAFGVKNHYKAYEKLGIDRWLAMVEAYRIYEEAVLVVDLGTALTIDYVSEQGEFMGGAILPGFKLMRESLSLNTTLKIDDIFTPIQNLGLSALDGVSSGIYHAIIGSILSVIHCMPSNIRVVLSGGRAEWVKESLLKSAIKNPLVTHQHLVLRGLLNYSSNN